MRRKNCAAIGVSHQIQSELRLFTVALQFRLRTFLSVPRTVERHLQHAATVMTGLTAGPRCNFSIPATVTVLRTSSAQWRDAVKAAASSPSGVGTTIRPARDTPSSHLDKPRHLPPSSFTGDRNLCIKHFTVDFVIFYMTFSNS